jgi:hypothetical protein
MKINIDSVSAVKITENEGRVNAQSSDAIHASQRDASQKLPERSDIRGISARAAIRKIPHRLAIRMPEGLTGRAGVLIWPSVN